MLSLVFFVVLLVLFDATSLRICRIHHRPAVPEQLVLKVASQSPILIKLRVSEVAACIGRHYHVPKEKAMLEFLRRSKSKVYKRLVKGNVIQPSGEEAFNELPAIVQTQLMAKVGQKSTGKGVTKATNEVKKIVSVAGEDLRVPAEQLARIQQFVVSQHHGAFGTIKEAEVVKLHNITQDLHTYSKLAVSFLHEGKEVQIWMRGQSDGIEVSDDGSTVVTEIKNRIKGFRGVADHERIQLLGYLFILGHQRGRLMECYDGQQRVHSVLFGNNRKEWQDVEKQLEAFGREYLSIINGGGSWDIAGWSAAAESQSSN